MDRFRLISVGLQNAYSVMVLSRLDSEGVKATRDCSLSGLMWRVVIWLGQTDQSCISCCTAAGTGVSPWVSSTMMRLTCGVSISSARTAATSLRATSP